MSSYNCTKIWLFLAISLFPVLLVDSGVISGKPKNPTAGCKPVKREILVRRMGRNYNKHFMADSPQLLNHQGVNHVTKRGRPTPDPFQWTCKTTTTWEDLGQDFFPQSLRKTTCNNTACWFGHFSCRPKIFHIQILKRKPNECNVVRSFNGSSWLEENWELVNKDVTYYCECGH